MTWREALRAMSIDAQRRSDNSRPRKNGPDNDVRLAEQRGAAYAFSVMAEELKYLSDRHTSSKEAMIKLRRLLASAQDEGCANHVKDAP
jgi:hypothetical protein